MYILSLDLKNLINLYNSLSKQKKSELYNPDFKTIIIFLLLTIITSFKTLVVLAHRSITHTHTRKTSIVEQILHRYFLR